MPAPARFEFVEGSSKKFWEIELDGTSFTTTHGRIGTNGSVLTKNWPDADTAWKEYDKLLRQKIGKGYKQVGGKPYDAKKAQAKAKTVAASSKATKKDEGRVSKSTTTFTKTGAFNASLAKRIDANPDDDDAWAVYADWLQAQGDPRGELAVAQEGLRANPKDKTLLSAERHLLSAQANAIVGEKVAKYMRAEGKRDIPSSTSRPQLEPEFRDGDNDIPVRAQWRGGFFTHAFVGHPGFDATEGVERDIIPNLLDGILAAPVGRFLQSLRIGMPNRLDDGDCDYADVMKKVLKNKKYADALGRLQSLYIGDITQEESEVSNIDIGDLTNVYPMLKKLRSLTVRGGLFKLGTITGMPELRELTIITGGLDKKNLASICAAKFPKLEKLEIWLGDAMYGANTKIKDLAPIFDGKPFPKLTHLGLRNSDMTDEIAAAIPGAKIMKRLEGLDLSKGTMSGEGVRSLLKGKSALQHLARLDLSDNFLEKGDEKLATSITKQVRTKPQRKSEGEGDRYVALSE